VSDRNRKCTFSGSGISASRSSPTMSWKGAQIGKSSGDYIQPRTVVSQYHLWEVKGTRGRGFPRDKFILPERQIGMRQSDGWQSRPKHTMLDYCQVRASHQRLKHDSDAPQENPDVHVAFIVHKVVRVTPIVPQICGSPDREACFAAILKFVVPHIWLHLGFCHAALAPPLDPITRSLGKQGRVGQLSKGSLLAFGTTRGKIHRSAHDFA
jgi:hypothetical protein